MPMEIQATDETVTVFLSGEIDHHTAAPMREEIDSYITASNVTLLVMDFGGVTFMDSSGIGLVMGRYRQMQYNNGTMQIINTPPPIYKVMRIAGLHRLATITRGGKTQEDSSC